MRKYAQYAGVQAPCTDSESESKYTTNQTKGYPFEVAVPSGQGATGVILSDRVKSVDWKARREDKGAKFAVLTPRVDRSRQSANERSVQIAACKTAVQFPGIDTRHLRLDP